MFFCMCLSAELYIGLFVDLLVVSFLIYFISRPRSTLVALNCLKNFLLSVNDQATERSFELLQNFVANPQSFTVVKIR